MKGIQTPYTYVGSALTSFALHVEDGNLNSINYLHFGQQIVWYVIPNSENGNLEKLVKKMAGIKSLDAESCNLYIRHKMTMIPPSVLKKHKINFVRVGH